MIILTLRTDKLIAELGLWQDDTQVSELTWEAHRQLADTIHIKIQEILTSQSADWSDINGIVIYKGPGSFTGLRISISVANALAYGMHVPIVAQGGEDWCKVGINRLLANNNDQIVMPDYGADAHITMPKK